jgi:predicted ATP-grasp superfamily ATP-dependent carboligase
VRALAASAAGSRLLRRRFPGGLLAIDYFADADLLALRDRIALEALSVSRDLGMRRSLLTLHRAALERDWQALIYAGGLENRPALLARLERRGAVLGNAAAVVQRVRDPRLLFPFLRRAGIPHPWTDAGVPGPAPPRGARFLHKTVRSGGGGRVRPARPRAARQRGAYLQEFVAGPVMSAAFVADGRRAVLLGISEQMAGWKALGGAGFRYGGNTAGPADAWLERATVDRLAGAAGVLAGRFGLRGLNGFDFVLAKDGPRLIEINPRYTASMELIEERIGLNLFDVHLGALEGALPKAPLERGHGRGGERFLAKGILYAERPARGAGLAPLLALGCRDVPADGESIAPGQPICTVIASGRSPAVCRSLLVRRAARVRRLLERPPATVAAVLR